MAEERTELNDAQKFVKAIKSGIGNLDEEIIDFLGKKGFTDISVQFGQFSRDRDRIHGSYNRRMFTLYIDARLPETDDQ